MKLYSILLITVLLTEEGFCDTPANCTYEDAHGKWSVSLLKCLDSCSGTFKMGNIFNITLLYPNLVLDNFGNRGTWTLVYNQGFEVSVANRKWLFMFSYNSTTGESQCNTALPGLSHNSLGKQVWTFKASKFVQKWNQQVSLMSYAHPSSIKHSVTHVNLGSLVASINEANISWKAKFYSQFNGLNSEEMLRKKGGKNSRLLNRPRPADSSKSLKEKVSLLPKEFDWRFPPDGSPSPLSPVRQQGNCGSCYAFASAAALEARFSLMTNGTYRPILSPQDILDCSQYSEGCDGGFPYLIAGKYSEDVGMTTESEVPYEAKQKASCQTPRNSSRHFATNYHYVGGYYGACNEELMQLELVNNGPFPIGFEVYDDFMAYESGVYVHTVHTLKKFEPFELTNHAVLLVGYGVDPSSGLPFWALKNSWGVNWGEKGYFRIVRGIDECAVESLAVSVEPIM